MTPGGEGWRQACSAAATGSPWGIATGVLGGSGFAAGVLGGSDFADCVWRRRIAVGRGNGARGVRRPCVFRRRWECGSEGIREWTIAFDVF